MPGKNLVTQATYMVSYDSSSHVGVLTQMWGSIWPKVFPYCLFNVLVMAGLVYVDSKQDKYNIQLSTQGHGFITVVVAFLLVSRINIALGRFNEARGYLGTMYRESRELIQNACVLSSNSKGDLAKAWRHEMAYRMLILLRTTMAVIDYPVDFVPAWSVPELRGAEREEVHRILMGEHAQRWAHTERGEWENTMRVPIRIAYLLRRTIHNHSTFLNTPLPPPLEVKLFAAVDTFMGGYYGMRKFLTTPVPFPLIQMARTFLFLYIFTIPFVLLSDKTSSAAAKCFLVFLITFGFMGLELVAIELDNPFGDDDNDFKNTLMAVTAYEDTYLTIADLDGEESASELRRKMDSSESDDEESQEDLEQGEKSPLIGKGASFSPARSAASFSP